MKSYKGYKESKQYMDNVMIQDRNDEYYIEHCIDSIDSDIYSANKNKLDLIAMIKFRINQ